MERLNEAQWRYLFEKTHPLQADSDTVCQEIPRLLLEPVVLKPTIGKLFTSLCTLLLHCFFFLQYPWKHTCTPPPLTGVSVHLARIFPHERYIPAHPVISLSQRYVCISGTQAALPNTVRANNCHFVMQTTRPVFCNADLLRSFVATDTYEVCPESIQPFWISREPVAWLWCNVAASQRRPYCASVNSHSPLGLVSRQWDAVDWACVLRDRRIHKSPPFQRRFYLWEKPEFAGSQI